jgi:hypothetical protein
MKLMGLSNNVSPLRLVTMATPAQQLGFSIALKVPRKIEMKDAKGW